VLELFTYQPQLFPQNEPRYFGLARRVRRLMMLKKQFSEVEDACALAQAMVDTVRDL
jgi:hypothetical protein